MLDAIRGRPGKVAVDGVFKRYYLTGPTGMMKALFGATPEEQVIWALRDVSFQVNPGEVYAIMGRNGSGKSTMLKLLAQIMSPTRGKIHVDGRLSCLIEVGAGFHPELTGRENIRLHGAISGMTSREVNQKMDSIVEFAGVSKFIDMPVKNYSSGMFTRLGFAVSIHSEPAVLLVDEVLAVGDQAFQTKCLKTLAKLREDGTAIILVSHNMFTVANICTRGIWIDLGVPRDEGAIDKVIKAYETGGASAVQGASVAATSSEIVTIHSVNFTGHAQGAVPEFQVGAPLSIELDIETRQILENPVFACGIFRGGGEGVGDLCGASDSRAEQVQQASIVGRSRITITLRPPRLIPEDYTLSVKVCDSMQTITYMQATLRCQIVGNYPALNPDYFGRFLLDQDWSVSPVEGCLT